MFHDQPRRHSDRRAPNESERTIWGTQLERGQEGGESYLCHYSVLGFYSKLEKHQVLSKRMRWSDFPFKTYTLMFLAA